MDEAKKIARPTECPECGSRNLSAEVVGKAYTDFRLNSEGEWEDSTQKSRFDDWDHSRHYCHDCGRSWIGYEYETNGTPSNMEDMYFGDGENSLWGCPHCANDDLSFEKITGNDFLQDQLLESWSCSDCGCKGIHFYRYEISIIEKSIKVTLVKDSLSDEYEEFVFNRQSEYITWAIEKAYSIEGAYYTHYSGLEELLNDVNIDDYDDADDIRWELDNVLNDHKGRVSFSCDGHFHRVKPVGEYSKLEWAEYTISKAYSEFHMDGEKYDSQGFWVEK